jgi:hypothetical protein
MAACESMACTTEREEPAGDFNPASRGREPWLSSSAQNASMTSRTRPRPVLIVPTPSRGLRTVGDRFTSSRRRDERGSKSECWGGFLWASGAWCSSLRGQPSIPRVLGWVRYSGRQASCACGSAALVLGGITADEPQASPARRTRSESAATARAPCGRIGSPSLLPGPETRSPPGGS